MHGHGPAPVAGDVIDVHHDVHARRWVILAVLSLSLLITSIDHTITNVALPRMVTDLGASTSQLQWIVDAYTVVFAGLLLTAGALGDRFGRKGALQLGLLVFLGGSLLAATAGSAGVVIAARGIMGAGGALIMPSTLSILTNVFADPSERARAIGTWAGVAGVGVALGPIAGGYLLEHFSWSSVFWVNVPVVAGAVLAVRALVPRQPSEVRPLDPAGALLSIVALVLAVYAVIEAPAHGWVSGRTLATFAAAAVAIELFVLWERRHPTPMLDVRLFSNPRFSAPSVAITLTFFAMAGAVFLLTQHLQFVLGFSPLRAGVGILPAAVALFLASSASAHLASHVGVRAALAIGLSVAALGLGFQALVTDGTGYLPVGIGQTLLGLGLGLAMAPATTSIMASLPAERAGIGSAVNDTTREVGSALGVAVVGSVAGTAYGNSVEGPLAALELPPQVAAAVGDNIGASFHSGLDGATAVEVARVAADGFVDGLHAGLWVAAAVAATGAVIAFVALPGRRVATVRPDDDSRSVHSHAALDGAVG